MSLCLRIFTKMWPSLFCYIMLIVVMKHNILGLRIKFLTRRKHISGPKELSPNVTVGGSKNIYAFWKTQIFPDVKKTAESLKEREKSEWSFLKLFAHVLVPPKALRNWKIFLKALSKWLWKLTIKTKRLWRLKFLSFVKVND